jgi:Histidine kinase-, DNA gyrase B-, and HSP90-like ATPase
MTTFTVDTHLFRELGELLVGRDSTALVELIKNAYDADATEVVVYGERLSDLEHGFIRVRDDGIGMGAEEFRTGFLRIAARSKDEGQRRSSRFKRRYTGAKGVGRLAAHKLARLLEIHTLRWHGSALANGHKMVEATIDWDAVEATPTLDELEKSHAIWVTELPAPRGTNHGTTITLRRLRRKWTGKEHGRFLEEIQTFQVPAILAEALPETVLPKKLLLERTTVRDVGRDTDQKFGVRLEGDLAPPEDYWTTALHAADWVIEIDADSQSKNVLYGVAPTERARKKVPNAAVRTFTLAHPEPETGPFFQARILVRTGAMRGSDEVKGWVGRSSGIRVYMEGFRVLPYGEPSNDWLALDRDAAERNKGLLVRSDQDPLAPVLTAEGKTEAEGLSHLPNKHYFGAVFLTQARAAHLRLLVNREGFVPDAPFTTLVDLVRVGIDLATRVRAAATLPKRKERKERRAGARDTRAQDANDTDDLMPTALKILDSVERAHKYAKEARSYAAVGSLAQSQNRLEAAIEEVAAVSRVSKDLIREGSMLRVLASVGTQLAAFIHEINGLLGPVPARRERSGRG